MGYAAEDVKLALGAIGEEEESPGAKPRGSASSIIRRISGIRSSLLPSLGLGSNANPGGPSIVSSHPSENRRRSFLGDLNTLISDAISELVTMDEGLDLAQSCTDIIDNDESSTAAPNYPPRQRGSTQLSPPHGPEETETSIFKAYR